jgi:hypothetical protein
VRSEADVIRCAHPTCRKTLAGHKWSKIKSGWFFTKPTEDREEEAFCPEHIPEWVEEWRAKKRAEAAQRARDGVDDSEASL